MDHQFRNAAFGGFNRQDVLDYLESSAQANQQQLQQLQDQLDQVRQELEQAAVREQELLAFQTEAEGLRTQLEQSKAQVRDLTQALEASQQRVQQLDLRVTQLEPDAMAYAAVKERSAGVELEAHRRAQSIQAQAEEEVRRLRQRTDQWLQRLGREYDELRTQVETTISHAADQLDRAGRYLSRASDLMEEQNLSLESLSQTYAETDPERVAPPMPIPEEE